MVIIQERERSCQPGKLERALVELGWVLGDQEDFPVHVEKAMLLAGEA